jgi:hypothetical protein
MDHFPSLKCFSFVSFEDMKQKQNEFISFSQIVQCDDEVKTLCSIFDLDEKTNERIDKSNDESILECLKSLTNQTDMFKTYSVPIMVQSELNKRKTYCMVYSLVPKSQSTNIPEIDLTVYNSSLFLPLLLNNSILTPKEWIEKHQDYIQFCIFSLSAQHCIVISYNMISGLTIEYVPENKQKTAMMRLKMSKFKLAE